MNIYICIQRKWGIINWAINDIVQYKFFLINVFFSRISLCSTFASRRIGQK